jgi:hypothetical protein
MAAAAAVVFVEMLERGARAWTGGGRLIGGSRAAFVAVAGLGRFRWCDSGLGHCEQANGWMDGWMDHITDQSMIFFDQQQGSAKKTGRRTRRRKLGSD